MGVNLEQRSAYRANVALVVCKSDTQVLWARRVRRDGWQFPQGGVAPNETTDEAAYRELEEELGLKKHHVRLIGSTQQWFKYDIPRQYLRSRHPGVALRGQKQKWFLFEFIGDESDVCLDCSSYPEFDDWKWVDYRTAADQVIDFKQQVYRDALAELEPYFDQVSENN